ncbi:F-BAR domain only protein 2, partial [Ataeniobius toweri]|nr:F-BAR domain only protein 2 [Ataeniobius toweri]
VRPFSPPKASNASPTPTAPLARAESSSSLSSNTSHSAGNTPTVGAEKAFAHPLSYSGSDFSTFSPHVLLNQRTSRGPSPVTLASQDALPIAVAFTETVNAYFKGADPAKCIVKITGDMTLSFPMGIIKVFTTNPTPAVLSFKLKNTSRLEQILPNQQLLY